MAGWMDRTESWWGVGVEVPWITRWRTWGAILGKGEGVSGWVEMELGG